MFAFIDAGIYIFSRNPVRDTVLKKVERNDQICRQFTARAYLKSSSGLDILPTITYGYRNHRITPSELSIIRGGDSKK